MKAFFKDYAFPMSFFRCLCLIVCIMLTLPQMSSGQSINGVDFQTVNVDELSDSQISSLVERARARGLSQSELEGLARQRGMSETDLSKLRARILALSSGVQQSATVDSGTASGAGRQVSDDLFEGIISAGKGRLNEAEKKIFGFSLFQNSSLTFAPNLNIPTPEGYKIGPGDEVLVDLWGNTQQSFRLGVSPEGSVKPDRLGPIYINGLSIKEASVRIIERMSQVYSGLKGVNGNPPTISYQVSLGKIRTIQVEVIGDVEKPGLYSLPSLATVYTALHSAGGPSQSGSFREIRLIRDNKLKAQIDIYTYLKEGIRMNDEQLRSGDLIIVPPFKKRIELIGPLRNQGLYELKEGESLRDAFEFADGFSSTAHRDLVTVKRIGGNERELLDVSSEDFDSFIPMDGDRVEVSSALERYTNRVAIDGAVQRGGEYQLTEGMTLSRLIEKAGGLRGDAFAERATIYRTNEDYSVEVLPVDLKGVLDGSQSDVALVKEDVIQVPSVYNLQQEWYVQISGEVNDEGVYPYFHNMTVEDLVVLADGLRQSASGSVVEIARRNRTGDTAGASEILSVEINKSLNLSSENRQLKLEPFDQVIIRKSPGYEEQKVVVVEGEVLSPGDYVMSTKDERISDLVKRAGGLTTYAYPQGAILIRRTEFSSPEDTRNVGLESLRTLRAKILSSGSELKNTEKTELLDRLTKIENRRTLDRSEDLVGSGIKRDLIRNISRQDSLVRRENLSGIEPVAIELSKILESPGSKYDLILKQGDVISIPGKLETVRVTGEVASPLNFRFDESFDFKDYIDRSGGFLTSAKRGRSFVQYPNGERKGVRKFLFFKSYPKIEPGSTIFVARRPVRNSFNVQGAIGAAGSVVTLVLLIDRITN